jgi:hypothetical protein
MRITRRQLKRIIREAVTSWQRAPGSTGRRRSKGEKEFILRVRQQEEMDFVVLAHDEQQANDDLRLFLDQGMPMEELRAGKWHSIQLLDKIDWDAQVTKSVAGTDYSRDPMGWGLKDEQLTETIEKLANGKFRLYSKKKDPKTGDRKNLGTYDSREAAEEREQQVNYFKHKD